MKTKALCEFRFPDQLLSIITSLVCLNYTNCITGVLTIFGVQDSVVPPLEPMGIILRCCNLNEIYRSYLTVVPILVDCTKKAKVFAWHGWQ